MTVYKVFARKEYDYDSKNKDRLILSMKAKDETLERLYAMAWNKKPEGMYISKIQCGKQYYPYYKLDEKVFQQMPKEYYEGIEVKF